MLETFLKKEVIAPILIVFFTILIYLVIKNLIKKISFNKNKRRQKTLIVVLINIIKYFLVLIDVLIILEIYGIDTKSIIASLGVVGLVLGLALQDLLKDFISGFSILFEDQFGIGDTVTINGFTGEVIYLGLKTTRIRSFKGEVKILANRNICEVTNLSLANSLAIVDVSVAYDTDFTKLEKVLNDLCLKLNKEIKNLTDDIKILGIQAFGDSAITYRLTAKTKPMEQYQVEREIRLAILEEFKRKQIEIPFPQVVVHHE